LKRIIFEKDNFLLASVSEEVAPGGFADRIVHQMNSSSKIPLNCSNLHPGTMCIPYSPWYYCFYFKRGHERKIKDERSV